MRGFFFALIVGLFVAPDALACSGRHSIDVERPDLYGEVFLGTVRKVDIHYQNNNPHIASPHTLTIRVIKPYKGFLSAGDVVERIAEGCGVHIPEVGELGIFASELGETFGDTIPLYGSYGGDGYLPYTMKKLEKQIEERHSGESRNPEASGKAVEPESGFLPAQE